MNFLFKKLMGIHFWIKVRRGSNFENQNVGNGTFKDQWVKMGNLQRCKRSITHLFSAIALFEFGLFVYT